MDLQFVRYTLDEEGPPPSISPGSQQSLGDKLRAENAKHRRTRNSNPCQPCKSAKRRCDLASPKCTRCSRQKLDCRVLQVKWKPFQASTHADSSPSDSNAHSSMEHGENSRDGGIASPPDHGRSIPNLAGANRTTTTPAQSISSAHDTASTNDKYSSYSDPSLVGVEPHDPLPPPESTLWIDETNFWDALHDPVSSAFLQWDHGASSNGHHPHHGGDNNDILSLASNLPPVPMGSRTGTQAPLPVMQERPEPGNKLPRDSRLQEKRQRRHLWNIYTSELVNTITAHKSDFRNPLVDYFLPRALESSSFRSAILYLAFVMESRRNETQPVEHVRIKSTGFLEIADLRLASHLEKEAHSDHVMELPPETPSDQNEETRSAEIAGIFRASSTSFNTLATLLILCTAYISSGNSQSLLICLEQAFILAKKLWDELASNQEFIFLTRWLGYIHTTAMLSPGDYSLKAPDFLTLATASDSTTTMTSSVGEIALLSRSGSDISHGDAEVHSQLLERSSLHKLRQEFQSSCFGDIAPTTGISNVVAALLYDIGRLSRQRSAILTSETSTGNNWFWGDFEAALDGLKIQMEQMVRCRNMRTQIFESLVRRLSSLHDEYKEEDLSQTIDLNRYNDALVQCGRIIIRERIEDKDGQDDGIVAAVGRVLDLCALISPSSHTAKLMALPLFIAGSWACTEDSRSFVVKRLCSLAGDIVSDTPMLIKKLQMKWKALDDMSDTPSDNEETEELLLLY